MYKWMGECVEVLLVMILIKHCVYLRILDDIPVCNMVLIVLEIFKAVSWTGLFEWKMFHLSDFFLVHLIRLKLNRYLKYGPS